MAVTPKHPGANDINEVFRGGARSVEFLDEINKASVVMLSEAGILPQKTAALIAGGMAQLLEQEQATAPTRSADYLDYEPRLTAIIGPEASRLHTGRSRQDIASTIARMNLRDGLVQQIEAMIGAREKLCALASQHTETIIPAYTHGVQAQPTTLAQYLLAFASAFTRHVERLRQVFARTNRNPLGAAALATSSFPLDRERLAVLLGFEGVAENAYDANHLAPVDSAIEVASALSSAAVQIGHFAQDLHAQYAEPRPWMVLSSGKLTGVSSIMPQKRNPAALEQLRAQSSILVGEMHTVTLICHNNRTGMFDYRSYDPVPGSRSLQVLKLFADVIEGLMIDRQRALEEVRADYSTTTEIADALLQKADVPFRIGHHFASALTDYGRGRGILLSDIPYDEANRLYREHTSAALPLSEEQFRETISPEYMVFGRRGLGGPQVGEVKRMLRDEQSAIAHDRSWLDGKRSHLQNSAEALNRAFTALARAS